MKILLGGASGFIGTALKKSLEADSHEVVALARDYEQRPFTYFDHFDTFINLSGESIATRWTKKKKEVLIQSRVGVTSFLAKMCENLSHPPRLFFCASAIGFYGDRKDEVITEGSSKGEGFLADLCQKWEESVQKAKKYGVQVVSTRFGLVLGKGGGILKKFILPVRFGSGEQYVSWIHIEDLTSSIVFLLRYPPNEEALNLTSPNPVPEKQLAHLLASLLHKPCLVLPSFLLKIIFGEMSHMLLDSIQVYPKLLLENGFSFRYPKLHMALASIFTKG